MWQKNKQFGSLPLDRLNSGGWSRPASDILFYGQNAAGTDLLGTVALNATNGLNIGPSVANTNYTSATYPYTVAPYAFGVHGTGAIYAFHAGGAQVVLGDGSVRFISENINFNTFLGLLTPNGGESIGEFRSNPTRQSLRSAGTRTGRQLLPLFHGLAMELWQHCLQVFIGSGVNTRKAVLCDGCNCVC